LYVIATLMRPYGLESIGRLLCLFAAGGMAFALVRGPLSFFRNPSRRKKLQMNRVLISAAAATVLLVAATVPLPSGVSADAKIVPHHETPIYVKTSGVLRELSARPGDVVGEGDVIARLTNGDVELQYLTIAGRHETQSQVVSAMQRAALDSPEIANELPGQQSLLNDLQQQLTTHTARRDGLVIKSPASGRLIAAPRRAEDRAAIKQSRLVSWSGYPTDPQNENCFLEPGHELASVLGDDSWDAEIVMSQSDVQRIAVGADVKLALETMPAKRFAGVVAEIAKTKWDETQNADRRDDPDAARSDVPLATSYAVRVTLEAVEDVPMVTGGRATCRVDASPISIAGRMWRSLTGLFRFR
jgi:putative peptide zinc metalloprotease protein